MVDLKEDDDQSMDSALSQQVNEENDASKGDKLETADPDSEKPVKKQEPTFNPEQKSGSLKIVLIISIIVIVAILLLALILAAVMLLKDKSRVLEKDSNIKEAKITEEKTAYVTLADSVNLTKIEAIELIFSDNKSNEYVYNNSQISKKYEITAKSIGLSSFENITSVSASVTFKSTPAPPVNNTNTTNTTFVMCTDSCNSLGKRCGNWNICNKSVSCGSCSTGVCNSTGQCAVSCFDECATQGIFCQGNMRYNCSAGTDRCLYRTNLTACGTGEQCSDGACTVIAECTSNSTCAANFTKVCSIGFCNSTSKCRAIYNSSAQICRTNSSECDMAVNCTGSSGTCPDIINKTDGTACSLGACKQGKCVACLSDSNCSADGCSGTEYRDYFCNLTNGCQYNITTKIENLTNGNCNDGIDNDCNGLNDSTEANCTAAPVCGNGLLEGAACDDGNIIDGDGCSSTCTVETGWECTGEPSVCQVTAPSMSPLARFWEWIKDIF